MPGGLGGLGGGPSSSGFGAGDTSSLFGGGGFGGSSPFTAGDISAMDPFSGAFGGSQGGMFGGSMGGFDPISNMMMGGGYDASGNFVSGAENLGGQQPTNWQGGQTYGSTDQSNQGQGGGNQTQNQGTNNLYDQVQQATGQTGGPTGFNTATNPWNYYFNTPQPTATGIPQGQSGSGMSTINAAQAADAQAAGPTPVQTTSYTQPGTSAAQMTMPFPYGGGNAAAAPAAAPADWQSQAQAAGIHPPIGAEEDAASAAAAPAAPSPAPAATGPPPDIATLTAPSQGAANAYTQATTPTAPFEGAPAPSAADPAAAAAEPTVPPQYAPFPGEETAPTVNAPATTDAQGNPTDARGNPIYPGQTFTAPNGHSITMGHNGQYIDNTTGQRGQVQRGVTGPGGATGPYNANQRPDNQSLNGMGRQLQNALPQIDRMLQGLGFPPQLIGALNHIMRNFSGGMSNAGGDAATGAPAGGDGAPEVPAEGEPAPAARRPDEDGGDQAADGSAQPWNRPGVTMGGADTAPSLPAPGVQPHTGAFAGAPLETTAPNAPSQPAPAAESAPSAPIESPPLPAARPSPPPSQGGDGASAGASSPQTNAAQNTPAPNNPGDTPGVGTVPSNTPPSPGIGATTRYGRTPYRYGGGLDFGGRRYRFVSGGAGRGALPYGTYNLHPGGVGNWGQRHGAVAGISDRHARADNSVADPRYPGHRRIGVEVHPSGMRGTEGCIGIDGNQYRQFARQFRQASRGGQQLQLTVGPNGASIHPAGQGGGTQVASNAAGTPMGAYRPGAFSGNANADTGDRLISAVESDSNPSAGGQGTIRGQYQQSQGFQRQYGGNRSGRTNTNPVYQRRVMHNYIRTVMNRQPGISVGDVYAGYHDGTGNPGRHYSWRNLEPATRHRLMRLAMRQGINLDAPASQFFGGGDQYAMQ